MYGVFVRGNKRSKRIMDFVHTMKPLYTLSGFAVGCLVGMTGVGGGSLMTPLLILLFGIHPATAVGTDLLYAAATKTAGTVFHGLSRTVEWRIVALLAAGSVPATVLTLFFLYRFKMPDGATQHIITNMLAIALFITAIILVFEKRLLRFGAARLGEIDIHNAEYLTVAMGVVLGVLVSLTSVGAGALGVTALLLLYPRLPLVRIVGSDIAHAVPLTLCAGLGHWLMGSIDVPLLTALLAGSIPGVVLGTYLSRRTPERLLRLILGATLLLVGSKLLS
jgi:uncharacterized membrane protein YfcA